MSINKSTEEILLKPRWYVEYLGLESKVVPSNVVDGNSQGGLHYPLVHLLNL